MDNKQWRIKESLIKNFRIKKTVLSVQMGLKMTWQDWLILNLWNKITKMCKDIQWSLFLELQNNFSIDDQVIQKRKG